MAIIVALGVGLIQCVGREHNRVSGRDDLVDLAVRRLVVEVMDLQMTRVAVPKIPLVDRAGTSRVNRAALNIWYGQRRWNAVQTPGMRPRRR